jgi:hypothetical protein
MGGTHKLEQVSPKQAWLKVGLHACRIGFQPVRSRIGQVGNLSYAACDPNSTSFEPCPEKTNYVLANGLFAKDCAPPALEQTLDARTRGKIQKSILISSFPARLPDRLASSLAFRYRLALIPPRKQPASILTEKELTS